MPQLPQLQHAMSQGMTVTTQTKNPAKRYSSKWSVLRSLHSHVINDNDRLTISILPFGEDNETAGPSFPEIIGSPPLENKKSI